MEIVKGKSKPIVVYEILDYYPEEILNSKLKSKEIYENAISFFYAGEFSKAQDLFLKVLQITKEDKATKLFLERIEHLLKNADDWKGVSTLSEK